MKNREEEILHQACVNWFYLKYANIKCVLHHSPNENPMGIKLNSSDIIEKCNLWEGSLGIQI